MNKRALLLSIATLALLASTTAITVNKVYADDAESKWPPFIQGLIERFGLNENEVETFVEERQAERQQEKANFMNDRLEQAVTEGKLTSEQKDALLTKMEEFRSERQKMFEEYGNRARMHREELEAWADENGINLEEIGFGRGMGKGMRGHMQGFGPEDGMGRGFGRSFE